MRFDELDTRMRIYEEYDDRCVLPGMYIVARLDGRGFTRLTKELHKFEAPFDIKFRNLMIATCEHLMTNCGFEFVYGYTESDEISLLFSPEDNSFGRKIRKYNSVLAGEASAKFSLLLGGKGCFDCRICELPNKQLVIDYFRWRNEDAHRNALNSHCYWALRKSGKSGASAANLLKSMRTSDKNELLFQHGINYNELPAWQRRGSGLYWETYQKEGLNKLTGEKVQATRRRLKHDFELPMKEEYDTFLAKLLAALDSRDHTCGQ